MERSRRWLTLTGIIALLLVSATAGAGAFADGAAEVETADAELRSTDSAAHVDGDRVGPLTGCFAGDGYPISIGETGATIDALVHLSVLTDPSVGNEFGLEAAGEIGDDPIVTLAAGVRLSASEAITDGINPFAAFDLLYAYELRLPMFDGNIGETEYREDGSPITSAAGVVPC